MESLLELLSTIWLGFCVYAFITTRQVPADSGDWQTISAPPASAQRVLQARLPAPAQEWVIRVVTTGADAGFQRIFRGFFRRRPRTRV